MKFLVRWGALGAMRWPLRDFVKTSVIGEGKECDSKAKCHPNLTVKFFAKLIHFFQKVKHEQYLNALYKTHNGKLLAFVELFKN